MSNKIKKIIGLALAFNIISSVVPTALSVGTQAVYASSDNEGIKDITANKTLRKSSYSGSSTDYSKSRDEYYIKLSESTKEVRIKATPEEGYEVEVHEGSSSSDINGDDVSISKGKTKTFHVISKKDGEKKGDVTVKVKRESNNDDDDDDDIELKDLELTYSDDDIDFDFDEDKTKYDIKVKNEVRYVKVTAEPDDEDYKVRVNGERVKEEDDWETDKIELKEGTNEIKIKVEDDDDNSRTYTLNITRADKNGSTNTSSNNTTNNNNQAATKNTGWKYTNGKWQYYDANGNLYKNSWVTDAKGKNYYLGADGNMVTGWLTLGGNQYYFDLASGERKTGWICLGKTWYQFDSRGVLVK